MTTRAKLVAIDWDANQQQFNPASPAHVVHVHFNPESLKVSFANENRGGNQPGGGGGQFVGSGTSDLTVELLFDTTEPRGDAGESVQDNDVRRLTQKVAYFVQAKAPQQSGGGRNTSNNRVPPGISFEWGTFIFRGVVDSMDETLEYFSEDGIPMRATVSLKVSRQDIKFEFGQPGQSGNGQPAAGSPAPGSRPLEAARPGDSVQQMAGRQGQSGDWKSIAAANNIDDPLRLSAGALVDLNAGGSIAAGVSAGAGASIGAGASVGAGASAGASASTGGQVGFSAGLGGGVGFAAGGAAGASAGAGLSAGASAGAGFGAGASAGAGFGAGASAGAGLSAGASADAGISAGASAGAGFGTGASTSIGASAGASAGVIATASDGGPLVEV